MTRTDSRPLAATRAVALSRAVSGAWTAAIDLVIDSILGNLWFWLSATLIVTGISLVPVFGIGIVPLLLGIAVLRISGPVERVRANALLGTDVRAPRRRETRVTGWRRPFAQVFVDVRDVTTWRILLHHAWTALVGTLFVSAASVALTAAVTVFAGTTAILPFLGPVTITNLAVRIILGLALIAAIVGLAALLGMLDRLLAPLLGSPRTAELRSRIDTLTDARQGAVDAAAIERQRIERDLHDGAQPRLVAMAMTLGMARAKFDSDPDAARAMLDQAHADAKAAITELRQLARGIHPAVLTDRGLDAALSALAGRCTVPTSIEVDVPERQSPEIEAVVYFTVAEALTNVSKHSRASRCRVTVRCDDGVLTALVWDDGRGGASIAPADALGEGGLAGIVARVRSAGGTLMIDSPANGPTELRMDLPCAS